MKTICYILVLLALSTVYAAASSVYFDKQKPFHLTAFDALGLSGVSAVLSGGASSGHSIAAQAPLHGAMLHQIFAHHPVAAETGWPGLSFAAVPDWTLSAQTAKASAFSTLMRNGHLDGDIAGYGRFSIWEDRTVVLEGGFASRKARGSALVSIKSLSDLWTGLGAPSVTGTLIVAFSSVGGGLAASGSGGTPLVVMPTPAALPLMLGVIGIFGTVAALRRRS